MSVNFPTLISVDVELNPLSMDGDEVVFVGCLTCHSTLKIDEPVTNGPWETKRLIGVCPNCSNWYFIEQCFGNEPWLILLPKPGEMVRGSIDTWNGNVVGPSY